MAADREAEYARIRRVMAELEAVGLTAYKIALVMGADYNTVKHWRETGRVQSFDAKLLDSLHQQHCKSRPMYDPQYCKTTHSPDTPQRQ